ncbi:MAG TPA: hypothetical protein DCQ06_06685 [Myxococcales bacterium]|nr:hypothetical protein [Myxococcales bacterium]HAN31269.1 hypothetical protein [Myxococcales bacterium]
MPDLERPQFDQVLMLSSLPPPQGGNAVHAERLTLALGDLGIEVDNWQPVELKRVVKKTPWRLPNLLARYHGGRRPPGREIFHVHASALAQYAAISRPMRWYTRQMARVITIHSGSFLKAATARTHRVVGILRDFHVVICVNEAQRDWLLTQGFEPERVCVAPAFLRPKPVQAALPEGWLPRRTDRRRLITSGSMTPIYDYGVLLDTLRLTSPEQVEIVLAIYNEGDDAYEAEIIPQLARHDNVTIYRDQSADVFQAMLADSDVYVRTSTTDGDAVAVREALSHGLAVVATDCVVRPSACVLFSTSDGQDLHRRLCGALPSPEVSPGDENLQVILNAYSLAAELVKRDS